MPAKDEMKRIDIVTNNGGGGSGLPDVTAEDNGKMLQVVDGQWTPVEPLIFKDYPTELKSQLLAAIQTNLPAIIQGAGAPFEIVVSLSLDEATDKEAFVTCCDNIIELVNNKSMPAYSVIGNIVSRKYEDNNGRYYITLPATLEKISTYSFINPCVTVSLQNLDIDNPIITVTYIIALLSSAS